MVIFAVIGVAAVFCLLFWLVKEKMPRVADKISEAGNKAESKIKEKINERRERRKGSRDTEQL